MKIINFNDFDSKRTKIVSEAATRIKKNDSDNSDTQVRLDDAIVDYDDINPKNIIGKKPTNDSDSIFSKFTVDAPIEGDSKRFDDKAVWSENIENVYDAIAGRSNFFIQGEAGWAKTAIITQMAKKFGYHVITVYLDKALPEDLGGNPVVKSYRSRRSGNQQEIVDPVMPWWGQYMLENPDKKFLLFFDELNQASKDVMNALMPICKPKEICNVKFDNYFVGAAGNMSYENDLETIPIPLMQRLGNRPIAWICGTDKDPRKAAEAWDDAFDYLHEAWDNKIGKSVVDAFNKYRTMFSSPRNIDLNLFTKFYNQKNDNFVDKNRITIRTIARNIKYQTNTVEGGQWSEEGSYRDANEYTPQIEAQVNELAEVVYAYLNDESSSSNPNEIKRKGRQKTTENKEQLEVDSRMTELANNAINGYYIVDGEDDNGNKIKNIKIPITRENILDMFDNLDKTSVSVLDSIIKRKGRNWKYNTNQDAIKSGDFDISGEKSVIDYLS